MHIIVVIVLNIGRFGRKKTVPLFDKGLSDHKPIFFGPPAMKASSRSLPEYNQQATTTINYAPDTPPVRRNVFFFLIISFSLFFGNYLGISCEFEFWSIWNDSRRFKSIYLCIHSKSISIIFSLLSST